MTRLLRAQPRHMAATNTTTTTTITTTKASADT